MAAKSYRELVVWQKAMVLVEEVYRMTTTFPKAEVFGLSIQLRRAAVSIPSNIAEGQGRRSTREFLSFLSIAYGSLMEVETQVCIATRLTYITDAEREAVMTITAEVGRLLNGLSRSLREKGQPR
jgi:four helix bundle protein